MEVKSHLNTPATAWDIFDSSQRTKEITWAPRRRRWQSALARGKDRSLIRPRKLSFSEAFEDDGSDSELATPLELLGRKTARLTLDVDTRTSEGNEFLEMTPSELAKKLEKANKSSSVDGKKFNENSSENEKPFRMMRASRRIRMESIDELTPKSR